MSNLVDSWLNGIGLGYAVPIFAGQGIDSPDMLSELDVVDFPELGITDQNDRKKLFYLIQRVKLALARGRAAEIKAAPQADSSVSTDPAALPAAAPPSSTGRHERDRVKAPHAAEIGSPRAGHNSTRFRRAPEVPSARGPGSPRAGAGGGGRFTPAKAQRLPPSHRRPKTPHADGNSARGGQQQPPPPPQSPARMRTAPAGGRRTRQEQGQEPVRRVAAATAETGGAAEHEAATTRALPQKQQEGNSSKRMPNNASGQQRRSVLEPVQLDEAGGRASVSSSTSSSTTTAASSMPPPPRVQHCRSALREDDSSRAAVSSREEMASSRPGATREEMEEQELRSFDRRPVAVVRTVPAQPPRKADTGAGAPQGERRFPEDRRREAPSSSAGAPSPSAAVADRSLPAREVARLHPAKREASAASSSSSSSSNGMVAPPSLDVPDGHGDSAGLLPGGGAVMQEQRRRAPSSSSAALPSGDVAVAAKRERAEDNQSAAAAAAGGRGRRKSAAELAVHLISAHREDVRSALAAARRDMDLVSKADQDRKPAALMEYAREVESVLGQRLEAGARLRQALDDYVARRQAAARGGVSCEEGGLQRARLQGGGRAVQA